MQFNSKALLAQFRRGRSADVDALQATAVETIRSDLHATRSMIGLAGLRVDFFWTLIDDSDSYSSSALLEMKETDASEWKMIDWSDYHRLGMYPLRGLQDLMDDLSPFMQTRDEKIVG